jgi:hypothetical protein
MPCNGRNTRRRDIPGTFVVAYNVVRKVRKRKSGDGNGMDLVFDRGDRQSPKGHALLYFRSGSDHEELWATYLVVLPITVDVSKYVPPFLMNQMGEVGAKDLSAFAFPPAPEKVPDYAHLENMAGARDDDILFGGTINPADLASAMMSVNEAVAKYSEMYVSLQPGAPEHEPDVEEAPDGASVNEVLYGLMSDGDRLSELTRLVGRLRDASENAEEMLSKDAETEINLLARHLPDNHQARRLIEATKLSGSRGAMLANLYLQRCFHLVQEEYVKLGQVEQEIKVLESAE